MATTTARIPKSLLDASREGRLLPFAGAGVSAAVRVRDSGEPLFPTWRQLLERSADALAAEKKPDEADWVRSSLKLREPDYISIASLVRTELGPVWYEFLREHLDPSPDRVDQGSLLLARSVWRISPFVITTNFDRVLQWVAPPDYQLWSIDSPAEQAAALAGKTERPILWHLHGTIDNAAQLVLTAPGYRHLYPKRANPEANLGAALHTLRTMISGKSLLFVGFSLDDPFIGAELKDIDRILQGAAGPHFALLREADLPTFQAPSSVRPVPFTGFGEPLLELLNSLVDARRPAVPTSPNRDDTEPVLMAPRFGSALHRTELLSRLEEAARAKSVVAVEGIAGSGKTFLVADQVEIWLSANRYRRIYWHDPQDEETLDDLLSAVSSLGVNGTSTEARCKSLVQILESRDSLLVIDDFHKLYERSVKRLLNAATEFSEDRKARLLVISRTYTDAVRNTENLGHVRVQGFSAEEARNYLQGRGFEDLRSELVARLCEVTNGLPIALSLFATLVLEFHRDPDSLLDEEMVHAVRLVEWFEDILKLIGSEAADLLRTLSLCDGPFNLGVVKLSGSLAGLADSLTVFEYLQRCYLIQAYSPYRWSLHALVASMASERTEAEKKRQIDLALGDHFAQDRVLRPGRVLSDQDFSWLVRACVHYQRAGADRQADRILHSISKTAKVRGHYESFVRIARSQNGRRSGGERWVRYHVAHCLYLLGRFQESLGEVEALVGEASAARAWNELANHHRLRAEILASLGMVEEGLWSLREFLEAVPRRRLRVESLNHARSTEAWLLMLLGRHRESAAIARECLHESRGRKDWLGEAVNLVRLASARIGLAQFDVAEPLLDKALAIFQKKNLRRATAWALLEKSRCRLRRGEMDAAFSTLEPALEIAEDQGECSRDYFNILHEFGQEPGIDPRQSRVYAELDRLSEIYSSGASQ